MSKTNLTPYIKARYPVLVLVSPEEGRAELEIARVAKDLNMSIRTWSHTDGFMDPSRPNWVEQIEDPIDALSQIRGEDTVGKGTIYLFRDLHPFYQAPKVTRLIRDIARDFKQQGKALIILSPTTDLPIDIQGDVTIIEFGLPGRDIIRTMLDTLVDGNKKAVGEISEDDRVDIVESCMGLTTGEAENAVAKAIIERRDDAKGGSVPSISALVMDEKAESIRKTGVLEYYKTGETIDSIGGLGELKTWLAKRERSFSVKARDFGLPASRGMLLVGMPGSGKSLAAKACANAFKVPLLRFDVGRVFGGLVGQSEQNMRLAIQTAEAIGQCVLWVDEIEKGFAGMSGSGKNDSGVTARVFGSFITWMQEKTAPVFIVATANRVESLPPEMMRKGRFDETFFVDLPTEEERAEILRLHINKRKRDADAFDIVPLAKASLEFSGAELEECVIQGLYSAFYEDRDLTTQDVLTAIEDTVPLAKSRKADLENIRVWATFNARHASKKNTGNPRGRKVMLDFD